MGPKIFPSTDQAIKDPRGVVMLYNGEVIKAEFGANCGGQTKDGGQPYLVPVGCLCYTISPQGTKLYGNGRGLCQWGAEEAGRRKTGYRTILKHYYKGITFSDESAQPPEEDYKELYQILLMDHQGQEEELELALAKIAAAKKALE